MSEMKVSAWDARAWAEVRSVAEKVRSAGGRACVAGASVCDALAGRTPSGAVERARLAADMLFEKTLPQRKRVYEGKIVTLDVLDVELSDGRTTKREIVRHGAAVAVLARRPDGRFIFVKQYRKAVEAAMVEIIAGGVEKGEAPEAAARRETAEETGYEVLNIRFLTTIASTPGFCTEKIHLYYADLSSEAHGQHLDAHEQVRPVVLTEGEVEEGIRKGWLCDAKTLSAWAAYRLMR